jgi:alpha/beta superfamily hydrolase
MSVALGPRVILPARREAVALATADGLTLAGELALPPGGRDAAGTLITLHPLPTAGGSMDSHVLRKAADRLPALADLAVLRFNTRGTASASGTSEGSFGGGVPERHDVETAVAWARARRLPHRWLVGWSFGSDLVLLHGPLLDVEGAILLSPPLGRAGDDRLDAWAASGKPLIAIVPEHDDYLRPAEARRRFARVPGARVIGVDGARHLWVGEKSVRRVLDEITAAINPAAAPLPSEWDGPFDLAAPAGRSTEAP